MPLTCEFQLSNRNGVYFSGDTITGIIILTTTTLIGIKDIHLLFKGEAKVNWDSVERGNNRVRYRGGKLFLEANTLLTEEDVLTPGSHRFNIQKILPLKSPTSCEGRFGHVRYELTLQLRRKDFDDYFTKPLTVISTVDLNLNPNLRIPVEAESVITSCSMIYCNRNIKSTLMLPYGGYVSGQRIGYCIRVENQSNHDIRGYTLQFIRIMTFTATTPNHKRQIVQKVLFEDNISSLCFRHSTRVYNGDFLIEATAPSTQGDAIIGVQYLLKVELELSCGITSSSPDKELMLKVVIGTVPIRENLLRMQLPCLASGESNSLMAVTPTAPTQPVEDENFNDLPPSYKDLGPPTFEEAIRSFSPFIDVDREESQRHINFIPLYPMYLQNDE